MRSFRGPIAGIAVVALSGGLMFGAAVPASASASTSGHRTVADRLAGDKPKAVENCGPYTCTVYHNRQQTRVFAEHLPGIMQGLNVSSTAICAAALPALGSVAAKVAKRHLSNQSKGGVSLLAGVAESIVDACETGMHKTMDDVVSYAKDATRQEGCLEVEKYDGKTIRVGYTTHPDWCGGN